MENDYGTIKGEPASRFFLSPEEAEQQKEAQGIEERKNIDRIEMTKYGTIGGTPVYPQRAETAEERKSRETSERLTQAHNVDIIQEENYGKIKGEPASGFFLSPEEAEQQKETQGIEERRNIDRIEMTKYGTIGGTPVYPQRAETAEERNSREMGERLTQGHEIDALESQRRNVTKAAPTKFANAYDDLDVQHTMEGIVAEHRREDAPKKEIVKALISGPISQNSAELKAILSQIDRLDFQKELLEGMKANVMSVLHAQRNDFGIDSSSLVNSKLEDYLAVIATLSSMGYQFGSQKGSYKQTMSSGYDPYRPDLELASISDAMHKRFVNGADTMIPIPKGYDKNDPQKSADAVKVLYCLDNELSGNEYADVLWRKLGYEDRSLETLKKFEAERNNQMALDQAERKEQVATVIYNTGGPKL